jgi:hypothetical protein
LSKVHTQDEIEKFYLDKGYKVLSKYVDNKTPIDILELKTGYMFESYYNHFKNGEVRTPFGFKNKKFQEYNIKLFLKNKNPNIKFISIEKKRIKSKTRNIATLECSCGNKFKKEWTHVMHDKRLLCPTCAKNEQTKKKRAERDSDAIKKIESLGYHFEEYPEHIFGNELVEVVQNKTGYKVMVTATQLERRKQNNIFSEDTNKHNLLYNINKYIENNDLDCEAIRIAEEKEKSSGKLSWIEMRCSCGRLFYVTSNPSKLKRCNARCSFCNQSVSIDERKVKDFLDELNIKYKMQYTFNSCRNKKPLPFDFHLTDYDCLIEVDGEQHFEIVRFGGISEERAKENFEKQKIKDKIKNDFCEKNNIPLLRIPYWEFDNEEETYKQIILDFIKPFKINDLE